MFTEIDSRIGLVKSNWAGVRERVKLVNPEFSKLIDELSPEFSLYISYAKYGHLHGDTEGVILRGMKGDKYRLATPELSKKVVRDLGYGAVSSPLGMILEKNLEYYIDVPRLNVTLPRYVRKPGSLFPVSLIFQNTKKNRSYAPSGILNLMSGCRSAFMLPHIGSKSHYEKLKYDYNLKSPRPEHLYEHFDIFKELADSSKWRSAIIYFSQPWVEKILNDPAWFKVRMYLVDQGLELFEPETHKNLLDFVFSYIQIVKNMKPNPYVEDTARHIINTAIGSVPGYAPASDEEYLPVSAIEKPFIESYGMKKYFPTIMHARSFILENENEPIYYTLQYPGTHNFSPKSRTESMLVEMRELSTVLEAFLTHLSDASSFCHGTIYAEINNKLKITGFHNLEDKHKIVQSSHKLSKLDKRFTSNFKYKPLKEQKFASDGKFFRGCIAISKIK